MASCCILLAHIMVNFGTVCEETSNSWDLCYYAVGHHAHFRKIFCYISAFYIGIWFILFHDAAKPGSPAYLAILCFSTISFS